MAKRWGGKNMRRDKQRLKTVSRRNIAAAIGHSLDDDPEQT
jgi:hypothetical protein